MQQENTARIQVPPTERIAPQDPPTVRIDPGTPEDAAPSTKAERFFDQYTICSKIGNGGMGIVYLARDKRLGRYVAIKRLNSQAQSVPNLRQRFLQEARAVATLSHVHIVHIYSLGEDEDGPFIVMEYVAGPDQTDARGGGWAGGQAYPNTPLTLDQHVARHGQLTATEAAELLLKIGRAVAYAHSSGVIHRDLKPSNVLLDKSGEPKIVDFGLARLMSKDESKLTVPGEKLLSLGYGAPEQESDASLSDERADIYGLGALLYFTLTGQNPRYFREQDVPLGLREVVVKALATDREQRWQSAAAFNEALLQTLNKTKIETPTVKTTWRCKWCDAVNPLATKFCAECGWDGSEACPECGASTFVGVQYCAACGADARAYETLLLLMRKMRDAHDRQHYEKVVSTAGRVHGFEPAGPSGRKLLAELSQMRNRAEKDIARREQLKGQIPIELRAENYERAAAFIDQYREMTGEKQAFESEWRELPELTFRRDLARARKAVKNREWALATRLYNDLPREIAPEDPGLLALRHALRLRTMAVTGARFAIVGGSLLLAYLLSLPVAARFAPAPFGADTRAAYRPGLWVYERRWAGLPLRSYARLWLAEGTRLEDSFVISTEPAPQPILPEPTLPLPEGIKTKQEEYGRQLAEMERSQTLFLEAWPVEYMRELDLLRERRRLAGDFDGWSVAEKERKRFEETQQLVERMDDTMPELASLSAKYRQMLVDQKLFYSRKLVSLCKRYVNDLTDAQRALTQQGQMELAATVNQEIKRVRGAPGQLAAEAFVASAAASGSAEAEPPAQVVLPSARQRVQEVAAMRAEFEEVLGKIEEEAARRVAEWPEKYTAALVELMDKCQQAGDYDGWQGANDEAARFEIDRTIAARDIAAQPGGLAELQRRFLQRRDEQRRQRAETLVETTTRHIKRLEDLQKKFTREGQMEPAAVVNAEIRRVQSSSFFTEAQNELAPQHGPPLPPTLEELVGDPKEKPAEEPGAATTPEPRQQEPKQEPKQEPQKEPKQE